MWKTLFTTLGVLATLSFQRKPQPSDALLEWQFEDLDRETVIEGGIYAEPSV